MRAFVLLRHEDVTGVSGTGIIAEGVQFLNDKVVVQWIVGDHQSTVVWDSMDAVKAIHGHDGATEVVWLDSEHRKMQYIRPEDLGRREE